MTKYEKIAEEAIAKAEQVKAPFGAFVQGLKEMEAMIRERRELAQDEQRNDKR